MLDLLKLEYESRIQNTRLIEKRKFTGTNNARYRDNDYILQQCERSSYAQMIFSVVPPAITELSGSRLLFSGSSIALSIIEQIISVGVIVDHLNVIK